MKMRAGLKLCGRKPRQAPASTGGDQRGRAGDVVVAGQPQVVAVGEERQRGDRRDPRGQAVEAVDEVQRVDRQDGQQDGQRHADVGAERDRADVGDRQEQEGQLDAEQHHDAGRGDLAGELGERVEAPLVVEHAEQADQPAGDQDGVGLRVVEGPLQRRQPGGHEERGGDPEVHGHAAAPRRRDDVHVPLARGGHHPEADRRPSAPPGVARKVTSAAVSRTTAYSRIAVRRRADGSGIGRVRADQLADAGGDLGRPAAVGVADRRADERRDLLHVALDHALGGDRRAADPDAGGDRRRLRVVRDGVLVQHDAGGVAARLGVRAGHARSPAGPAAPGGCRCRRRPGACPSAARPSVSAWALAMTCRA